MFHRLFFHSVLFSWFLTSCQNSDQFELYPDIQFGEFPVGFRQIQIKDAKEPLKVNLWYPSKPNNADPLKFFEFMELEGEEPIDSLMARLSIQLTGTESALSSDTLMMVLEAPTRSYLAVEYPDQQFPLILWTHRTQTITHQLLLSEYLASYGFVVAFVENTGKQAILPWQIPNAADKPYVLQSHVNELVMAIDFLEDLPPISDVGTAVIGWSYAGESALLLDVENVVDLVIGLSGISFNSGVYLGDSLSTVAVPENLKAHYVLLTEEVGFNGKVKTPPSILDSLESASHCISFPKLAHGNFNFIEGYIPGLLGSDKVQPWSSGGENAKLGYELICQIVKDAAYNYLVIEGQDFKLNEAEYLIDQPSDIIKVRE